MWIMRKLRRGVGGWGLTNSTKKKRDGELSRWVLEIWYDKLLAHFLSVVKQPGWQRSVSEESERGKVWVGGNTGQRGDGLPGPRRGSPPPPSSSSSPSRDAPPDLEGGDTLLKHHRHTFKR